VRGREWYMTGGDLDLEKATSGFRAAQQGESRTSLASASEPLRYTGGKSCARCAPNLWPILSNRQRSSLRPA
jgi:hypothetical protein